MRSAIVSILACWVLACASAPPPPVAEEEKRAGSATTAPAELPAAPPAISINEELEARELTPGIWVITHLRPWPANSMVATSDDGRILLVGTPYTPAATTALLAWMDQRFGARQKTVVNTHFHFDGLGGNPALRDARVGAMGLAETAKLLKERGEAMRQSLLTALADRPEERAKFEQAELLRPSSIYQSPIYDLPFGKGRLVIIHPGPAHSPDNLAVYLPERKVLFGGCMVRAGSSLGNLADADLASWPKAIEELKKYPAEWVIPGHGVRFDPGLLDHTLELLAREARQDSSGN